MYYGNNPAYVFLAIPKTGTRTIYDILKKQFDGRLYKEHHTKIPKHLLGRYTFCVTRNPYDRACSMWWSTSMRGNDNYGFKREMKKINGANTLENFLKVVAIKGTDNQRVSLKQTNFITNNKINHVIRFEHLEKDFNELNFVTEIITLSKINTTAFTGVNKERVRPPWQKIVTQESINIINEIYADDFKNTKYDMITDLEKWQNDE